MMDEHATAAMREISGESHERNPATPTPPGGAARWYGAITWGNWRGPDAGTCDARGIFWAALTAPGKTDGTVLAPDGTNSALYWKTLADRLCSFYKALMDPSRHRIDHQSGIGKLFGLRGFDPGSCPSPGSTPWRTGGQPRRWRPTTISSRTFTIPMAVYVAATNNTDGRTFLQHIADWMERQRTMGPWAMIPYYGAPGQKDFGAGRKSRLANHNL
jgi:hypothetical protein